MFSPIAVSHYQLFISIMSPWLKNLCFLVSRNVLVFVNFNYAIDSNDVMSNFIIVTLEV